jgi:hypothetical protein
MKTRYEETATEALLDARHNLDISASDCDPDAGAWVKLKDDLTQLLFRAYIRNHSVDAD